MSTGNEANLQRVSWFLQYRWCLWKNSLLLQRRPLALLFVLLSNIVAMVLSWVVGGKGDPEGSIYPPPDAITECGTVSEQFYLESNTTSYDDKIRITLNEEWRDGTEVAMMGLGPMINAVFVFIVVGPEVRAQLLGVLRALGLRDSVYWLSWYSIFGLVSILSSLLGAVTAKILPGHVYESVYFFGIFASLLFLNLALVSASLFLVALCGVRGHCWANFCILIMILAAFIPLIVQLASSSTYPSNDVSGLATGLFWMNSNTTSMTYQLVGDNFTSSEPVSCEVPVMNQYQGNFLKTTDEINDVTNDEFFVGCFMQPSWSYEVWKQNKIVERMFMFFFPYFHFMNIWGSFVGYTSMPNRQFTAKEASMSQEELAIKALPRPPSPNSATTMAPQGSMFLTKINWKYHDPSLSTCSVGDSSDTSLCYYGSDCPYAEDPGAQYDAPTVLDSIGMLFALSVIYLIMAAYWSSVFDKGNGKGERFYFFLQPSYWFSRKADPTSESDAGVVVEELTKDYGKVEALKQVSFRMNPGEVTALLGHNGAGKTTLTSILCCEVGGTKGDIRVFGQSVATDSSLVRQMVGLCKQDDYLWPNMSAKEHLELYAGLRGVARDELENTVQKWLQSVDLDSVQLQYASTYSGGMKRRLSVALATIGDRPLIVLDEPTTGMDPVSRRFVWKHIDEIKEGRVILLTTHAMEEADLLADEVAILRKGEMAAFGSPLQLKSEHGTALQFNLLVDKNRLEQAQTLIEQCFVDCDEWVEIQASDAGTILVNITLLQDQPDSDGINIETLTSFLAWLDDEKSLVSEYGFSNSSLEEVFLKVTGDCGATPELSEVVMDVDNEDVEMTGDEMNANDLTLYTPSLSARNQAFVVLTSFFRRSWSGRGSIGNYCWFGLLVICVIVLFFGLSWAYNPVPILTVVTIMVSLLLLAIIGPVYTDRIQGQFHLMNEKGLLPLGFLGGLGLYAFTVQLAYNVLMLTGLFITPFFRESELCDPETDWESCYPGFGGRQQVEPVEIWNYNDEYEGEKVSLFAIRAPGGYGMIFGVVVVAAFATVGRTLATAFLPGYYITLASISLITLFVGILALLLGTLVQQSSDSYEQCYNITNPDFYCDGNFSKSNVNADFVDCVGFRVNDMALGTFCVAPQAALLPQVGMYQMLAMAYSSKVTFMSEPEDYVKNVFIPSLEGVQCKGATCDFPFANRLYGLNFLYTFLGGVLLLLLGLLVAYTLVFPVGPILHLRHMVKNYWARSKTSQRTNNVDTQNNVDANELPEVTEERESVIKILGPYLVEDEQGSLALDHAVIPRDDVAPAILHQVRKVYPAFGGRPPKVALESLDLHVPKGQVLGLLGKNGAGKTTALQILASAHDATHGVALVAGYDCAMEKIKVFERLGNCAQFDVVWSTWSVQRHLEFFAALKGLPRKEIPTLARAVASAVGLGSEDVYHRNAGLLSGGMRRRLSIAMSLIGAPRVLILDEPTTGLDPSTRSSIWSLINSFASNDRSMIITTHMMIEADTLCDRIAIVADGKLIVVGTQQHLKDKFGDGYVLQLNLVHNSPEYLDRATTFVRTRLHPEARLTSRQVKTLHFNLPRDINLESLFKGLYSKERITEGGINQFLLSQASLEDVFITLGDGRVSPS